MHCVACDAPMSYKYIEGAVDPDGEPVLEFCCDRCRHKAFENLPEDYYEGLYLDKHGHPAHVVTRAEEDYIL